ncbi:hypothetical protein CHLRE_07g342100v5 [Chlamydomonas reinhardtii]|uniref:Uncharacterized protein n=1 Tax=Chlamydomonas reinhardtii TaxID=3055 RepID=A0A2K3DKL6_CHLRE|nr:uncharacterized protein CHLRE_07g342100v5 [Chlamydomonas reinhardtii]PNW81075.1 hypothetical protein CHLRE_07g342100v5 [Chlamydomonas reinhardtii]
MYAAPLHQLVSIPASHYCDRARWALDLAGIPFAEYGWPPLLHYRGTMPSGGKSVPVLIAPRGDAAAVAAAAHAVSDVDARPITLPGKVPAGGNGDGQGNAKAGAKPRSPPKPGVLVDSADIVQYAHLRFLERAQRAQAKQGSGGAGAGVASSGGAAAATAGGDDGGAGESPLYPSDPAQRKEVYELEELFGRRLGVWTRVIAYQWLFQDRGMALDTLGLRQTGTMSGWKLLGLRILFPIIRTGVSKGLRVNAESAAKALERTRELFREVEARLARPGSNGYLVGGRFTAADLAFAAMASPVLSPPQYGAYLPPQEAWPSDFPLHELRRTPAGQYALRMYAQHRKPQAPPDPQPQPLAAASASASASASDPAGLSKQSRL